MSANSADRRPVPYFSLARSKGAARSSRQGLDRGLAARGEIENYRASVRDAKDLIRNPGIVVEALVSKRLASRRDALQFPLRTRRGEQGLDATAYFRD